MKEKEKEENADSEGGTAGCHTPVTQWMLFRSAQDVDGAWEAVAKATANNELGIAAKVAPRPEELGENDDDRRERLICVYTTDFRDAEDVRRVARKLRRLGLAPPWGRPLYYKPGQFGQPTSQIGSCFFFFFFFFSSSLG